MEDKDGLRTKNELNIVGSPDICVVIPVQNNEKINNAILKLMPRLKYAF